MLFDQTRFNIDKEFETPPVGTPGKNELEALVEKCGGRVSKSCQFFYN